MTKVSHASDSWIQYTVVLRFAAASRRRRCSASVFVIGFVTMTCMPRVTAAMQMSKWESSGVKTHTFRTQKRPRQNEID